jgi:hypothetical protein
MAVMQDIKTAIGKNNAFTGLFEAVDFIPKRRK